jgi:hypothetical protein
MAPPLLTSALDGGEWLASHPEGRGSGKHFIEGWPVISNNNKIIRIIANYIVLSALMFHPPS